MSWRRKKREDSRYTSEKRDGIRETQITARRHLGSNHVSPVGIVSEAIAVYFRICSRCDATVGAMLLNAMLALLHGQLIPITESGFLFAVAMREWEWALLCACGIVIGWGARGMLLSEASRSEKEPAIAGYTSELGTFWDPQAQQTWVISTSVLTFACSENNKVINARVCGGELEVHFRSGRSLEASLIRLDS